MRHAGNHQLGGFVIINVEMLGLSFHPFKVFNSQIVIGKTEGKSGECN
jgi:hypothetical protein